MQGTILIVDDDAGVRGVLKRWIGGMGHAVAVAASAGEALVLMREWQFDVAVCDVRMPGRDGIWLVEQLRREHPYTSIVLATGIAALDPTVTLRPGVVGYIVKPFDRASLAQVIQLGLDDCRERAERSGPARMLPAQNILEGVIVADRAAAGSTSRS